MSLQRWQRGGGRDFVFYHSHPSLTVGDEAQNAAFLGTICGNFQWATMLVAEQVCLTTASKSVQRVFLSCWTLTFPI